MKKSVPSLAARAGVFCLVASGAQASTVIDTTVFNPIASVAPVSSLTANTPPGAGRTSFGVFDINLTFLGTPTVSQIAAFTSAEAFWESRITGYKSIGVANFLAANSPAIEITADFSQSDGVGGVLGSAGSTGQVQQEFSAGNPSNSLVSVSGAMNFDPADIGSLEARGLFEDVVIHEMAHALGFSDVFWDFVGATDGSFTDATYTGAIALGAYQSEFMSQGLGPTPTFVPVETDGGPGTAFAHWDEDLFFDHFGQTGNSRNPELMTGFLEGPTYLSDTTLGAFDDIGYVTILTDNAVGVIPLPASALLLLGAGVALVGFGRRRA